ncbi:MAG: hypothetical protein RL133_1229 [Pseudomonadota bacterium]
MTHNALATDWTAYWASGALHSCVGSFRGNYEGAIALFWKSAWIDRIKPQDRVLDLGCGNGPLALLLLNASVPWGHYVGLDLAAISPQWTSQIPAEQSERIQFCPSTSMTHTALPSGSFDWVISQFGVEYASVTEWVAEVDRVSTAAPNLAFFMHHSESRLTLAAQEEVGHADWLFSEPGLMTRAAEMIEPMALSRTLSGRKQLERSAQAQRARDRFNQVQDDLNLRIAGSSVPDLLFQAREACAQILTIAQTQGSAPARQAWETWRKSSREARARQAELIAAAQSHEAVSELESRLKSLRPGLHSHLAAISEGRYLLGWGLSLYPQRSS